MATISDMRFMHLVSEAGTLLAEVRTLGATFEDMKRDKSLLDNATPQTIGAVIHDLQAQVYDLQRDNDINGIDPHLPYRLDEDEEYCYAKRSRAH